MKKILSWLKSIFKKTPTDRDLGIIGYIVNGKRYTKKEFDAYKKSLKTGKF